MSQYARLFCSTRIPEVKKDRLATFENARHMVVMRKGNFYVFDTITTDGKNKQFFVLNYFVLGPAVLQSFCWTPYSADTS